MKIIAIAVICLTIVIAFSYNLFPKPQRGKKIIEAWETTNNTFKVCVTAYAEENGGFVPGAYYVFRSTRIGSDEWQEIMTFRHDDPVPISRKQVQFVNEKIGYAFMGWMYAVTTDGGGNWSVWRAEKDLPNWHCCNYKLIQEVHLAPNGVGTMKLKPIQQREGEVPELHTRDFGQHWNSK
jgi:hypothetical protein